MVKEYLNLKTWNKIQEDISIALSIPVKTIDIKGNEISTSSIPFYCKMLKNKNLCQRNYKYFLKKVISEGKEYLNFECEAGVLNTIIPLKVNNKPIGAIIAGAHKKSGPNFDEISKKTSISKDELSEEYEKLKTKDNDSYINILLAFTNSVPTILHTNHINRKRVLALGMIKEVSNLINSSLETNKIITQIIRFIVENKYALACSVVTLDPLRRYTLNETTLPKHYTNFETKIINETVNDRKIHGIANISKDKRFSSDSHFNLYDAMVCIPIMHRHSVVGTFNLYSSSIDNLKSNIEFFSVMANQAGIAISNAKQYAKIKYSAITDKLTGLYNRRYFMDVLDQEIARSNRFGHPISVAMLDIDHFKHYNDTNGHQKGDKILQELTQVIKNSVRDVDTVGRYGGEEFIIVFPEIKPNEILTAADRIVKAVAKTKFDSGENQPLGKVTISMGLLTSMDSGQDKTDIIKYADKALYAAKDNGRNQVRARVILKKGMEPIDVN